MSHMAKSFAKTLKLANVELSLSLVRDPAIRELKREYFGIDAATDVLSFPAGDFPGPGPRPLGDIVISLDTAKRAAKELGTTLERELALYLVHGLLHLLGHDHQTRADARKMERLERKLLGHAGMLARSDELRAPASETCPLREALEAIHQAARAAGIPKPPRGDEIDDFIRKEIETSIEEATLGDDRPWWGMLVQDLTVPGMYVIARVGAERIGLWAGKGDGPALKAFSAATFGSALPAVLRKLRSEFGAHLWEGEVPRTDFHL